jgi:hypothetical protein
LLKLGNPNHHDLAAAIVVLLFRASRGELDVSLLVGKLVGDFGGQPEGVRVARSNAGVSWTLKLTRSLQTCHRDRDTVVQHAVVL